MWNPGFVLHGKRSHIARFMRRKAYEYQAWKQERVKVQNTPLAEHEDESMIV